jgi:cobalamin synthase
VVALPAPAVVALARRRLGGATGDVYGATAELCLLAALVAFVVHR